MLDWSHIELAVVLDCDQIQQAAVLIPILRNNLTLLPALCAPLPIIFAKEAQAFQYFQFSFLAEREFLLNSKVKVDS